MNQKLISRSLFIEVSKKVVRDILLILGGSLWLKLLDKNLSLESSILAFIHLDCLIGMINTGIDILGAAVDNRWNVQSMIEESSDPVLFHPVWFVLCLICYIITAPPRYFYFLVLVPIACGLFLIWKLLGVWWDKI